MKSDYTCLNVVSTIWGSNSFQKMHLWLFRPDYEQLQCLHLAGHMGESCPSHTTPDAHYSFWMGCRQGFRSLWPPYSYMQFAFLPQGPTFLYYLSKVVSQDLLYASQLKPPYVWARGLGWYIEDMFSPLLVPRSILFLAVSFFPSPECWVHKTSEAFCSGILWRWEMALRSVLSHLPFFIFFKKNWNAVDLQKVAQSVKN